jgi:Transposase IS66 family
VQVFGQRLCFHCCDFRLDGSFAVSRLCNEPDGHNDRPINLICLRAFERQSFARFLESRLQTDGYAAYDQIGGPKIVHAGCWSHAERYFSEAVQLNPQDPMATAIVARMDELFAIDAEARCQGLNVEARHARRQQQSRPLLGVIRKQIEIARSTALLGGALAKACNYTLTLWNKLTRFLEYPELELSNNLARTRCDRWLLVEKTGSTSEARRRDRRSRRSFPW